MMRFEGIIPQLKRRMHETNQEEMRRYYLQYISDKPCPACNGNKLKTIISIKIAGKNISEITAMSIREAYNFDKLPLKGNDKLIAEEILKENKEPFGFSDECRFTLFNIDRRSPTLSGGEAQRIRLASQIGSQLVGVMYILDEPTIGLHQRDVSKLAGHAFTACDLCVIP